MNQHDNCITVSQVKYIEDLLKQCNMKGCRAELTFVAINFKLQIEDGSRFTYARQYQGLIGKLMYLTHTIPDICFVVSLLSRFIYAPTKNHLGAVKIVLRYLSGTSTLCMVNRKTHCCKLERFSDSN